MSTIFKISGSIAFIQGELDNESWTLSSEGGKQTLVHKKWLSNMARTRETPYLKETAEISAETAKRMKGLTDEVRILECRKIFRERRTSK